MTEKRLMRIVRVWQQRLGLESWDVRVNLAEPCQEDANSTMQRSNQYERAEVRFAKDWRTWDEFFANQIVVHELAHLLTRDIDETVKSLLEGLGPEAGKLMERIFDRQVEALVDKLAYRFVEVGGHIG